MGIVAKFVTMVGWRDADEGAYECKQCGCRLHLRYYSYPECGGHRVERAEWLL